MTNGATAPKKGAAAAASMRRTLTSAPVAGLWISALIFVAIIALRTTGTLQPVELAAYDWLIQTRSAASVPVRRIALVTVTEEDIQTLGRWPIPNGTLAEALEELLRHQPRGIGIDIYLDVPVPPGREELEAVLSAHPNVMAVMKFPKGAERGVPPPSVLEDTQQFGFTDMLVDAGGIVRRGLLFLDDGQTFAYSLGLQMALLYLQPEGIVPQPDPIIPAHIRFANTTVPPFESNDGSYVGADAGGYQFLLDYLDKPGAFPTISLLTLLAGEADPELIRDKVILIGVAADSVKDVFYTPFSREEGATRVMPGVELHAHVVSQLLRFALDDAKPVKTLTDGFEALWILVWSVLGGLLGRSVRSPVRFSLMSAAGVLVLYGISHGVFVAGWWIPLVPPAIGWLVAATVVTAYVSYDEMQERAKLMHLFSRHISKQLAVDIWEHREQFLSGGHPHPQKLTATVFFSDVASFTTVSEGLEPQALMDWLNDYMAAMTPLINQHNGVILRFIGDAIMAVFGVPIPRTTEGEMDRDAVNTVNCALEMQLTLIEHNKRLQARGDPMIGMRIGIFTGPMVAGSIGDAERLEYNVHGDTVNTAARLESFQKEKFVPDYFKEPCRIYIGEPTRVRLGDRFLTEEVGSVQLKGKEHEVRVHRVIARKSTASEDRTEARSSPATAPALG